MQRGLPRARARQRAPARRRVGLRRRARPAAGGAAAASCATRRCDRPDTKWIWRCHIDLTDANPAVWEFFRPVRRAARRVGVDDAGVRARLAVDGPRRRGLPPCIDPLSVKNLDLPQPFAEELCRQYGIDVHRPIVCQVSRYDPWKDPVGVIEAFRIVREKVTDAQLVLAGSMATDDPEGFHVWEQVQEDRAGDPDIHLLSNIQQVGNVQINAFQRLADVVLQKSIREGFGLTVSEALWKGRPVVGRPRRRDRAPDPRRLRRLPRRLGRGVRGAHHRPARRPGRAPTPWARRAASTCARTSSRPASSRTGSACSTELRGDVIVVSNRGPASFTARDDGSFARTPRRRRASSVRSARCSAARRADGDRSPGSPPRMSDDDRAAVGAGAADRPRRRPAAARPRPRQHRLHYDVVSNAMLWFLHHGFSTCRAGPGSTSASARRGTPTRPSTARSPTTSSSAAPEATSCSCRTTTSRSCPDASRARTARPRGSRTSRTRRSADRTRSGCSPTGSPRAMCGSMATVPCGFHTERWARRVRGVARATCSAPDRAIAPTFVASLGPDPTDLARPRPTSPEAVAAADALDERVGDRQLMLRSDRVEPSKNIVRGFLAFDRLLDEHPEWRERVVFVALLYAVAPGPARVPGLPPGGRAGRGPGQRALGDRRLAADRARHARRLRPQRRRARALRRAAREPGEGRAQPGGEGRAAREPARRRGVPLAARRGRSTSCGDAVARPCTPTTSSRPPRRLHAALTMPGRRAARRGPPASASSPPPARPATGSTTQVRRGGLANRGRQLRRAARPAPAGPSTTRSACADELGRRLRASRRAMRTACSQPPVRARRDRGRRRRRGRRGRRRRSRRRRSPARAAPPPRCPCRPAPAAAARAPSASGRSRARAGAPALRPAAAASASRSGRRPPVHGDGDARLALDEQAGQLALGLVGRGRDRGEVGLDPRVDDAPAPRPGARARTGPTSVEPVDGERPRPRNSTGRPLTTPTSATTPTSRGERGARRRAARSRRRDRRRSCRERSVEVDEHRGPCGRARRAGASAGSRASGYAGRGGRRSRRLGRSGRRLRRERLDRGGRRTLAASAAASARSPPGTATATPWRVDWVVAGRATSCSRPLELVGHVAVPTPAGWPALSTSTRTSPRGRDPRRSAGCVSPVASVGRGTTDCRRRRRPAVRTAAVVDHLEQHDADDDRQHRRGRRPGRRSSTIERSALRGEPTAATGNDATATPGHLARRPSMRTRRRGRACGGPASR